MDRIKATPRDGQDKDKLATPRDGQNKTWPDTQWKQETEQS